MLKIAYFLQNILRVNNSKILAIRNAKSLGVEYTEKDFQIYICTH